MNLEREIKLTTLIHILLTATRPLFCNVRLLKILAVVNKFNGFVNFFVVYKTIPGCLVFAELHRDDNMIEKPLPGAKSRIVATNYPCCLNVRRGICLLPGRKDR